MAYCVRATYVDSYHTCQYFMSKEEALTEAGKLIALKYFIHVTVSVGYPLGYPPTRILMEYRK